MTGCVWMFACNYSNGQQLNIDNNGHVECNTDLPPGAWVPNQWTLY